jgi:hypothetical protein
VSTFLVDERRRAACAHLAVGLAVSRAHLAVGVRCQRDRAHLAVGLAVVESRAHLAVGYLVVRFSRFAHLAVGVSLPNRRRAHLAVGANVI